MEQAMSTTVDVVVAPPRHTPLLVGAVVTAGAAAVVPWMSHEVGPHLGFLPAVLAVVACFDLMSVYLLVQQFRSEGDNRSLAMAFAYTWSLVVMLGYAGAFPGVVGTPAPWATAPSVAPWLYVCWHTSFPVLLGLAWAPWRGRWQQPCPERRRTVVALATQFGAAGLAGSVVAFVVSHGQRLPVLIHGVDTSRMTALTAPVSLPLAAAAALWTAWALRHRRGPERWTAVAVWVCLLDLCLTYASRHRFSAGWYAGRTLTVIAAAVVLLAMLSETTRVKALLHATLLRERQVEQLQRILLDNLRESVVLSDVDGQVLMVNAATRVLLPHLTPGGPPGPLDVRGEDGTPLEYADRPVGRTARTGEPLRDVPLVMTNPDGAEFWLSANTTPVRDEDGAVTAVVSSYADVTARQQALRELAVARDVAVSADRAKSSFLAATSHEIRTPLNGLLGMTGLLQHTDLDPRQREFVLTAHACGEQLLALLNEVLDFSKAEAGHLQLDPQEMDLLDLADEALGMVAEPARANGLVVSAVVEHDVPRRVVGDALRLRQALLNLLSNAVKFTASGRVDLTVRLDDGAVRFEVADTGVGVDPAVVPQLFEPFRQADAGTTRRYGGTGLGLAIAREIASLHGGAVGAEPRAGGGSTFWFSALLPAAGVAEVTTLAGLGVQVRAADPGLERRVKELVLRAGGTVGDDLVVACGVPAGADALVLEPGATAQAVLHALAGSPQVVAEVVAPVALAGRVLLAEDNAVNQRVATLLLEGMGLTVEVVGNGLDAVTAALGSPYDVILMDCQMPELDGLDAARALRAQGCRTPVLALTAAASRQDELACLDAGMDGYLTKPIDVQALGRALAVHLPQPRTAA
jgi:signal transduction histidine kinase/CheY-like chemotaxis protein